MRITFTGFYCSSLIRRISLLSAYEFAGFVLTFICECLMLVTHPKGKGCIVTELFDIFS